MAKREKTIEQKQKDVKQSSIATGIFASVLIAYVILMIAGYADENPRAPIQECVSGGLSMIATHPLYFWPISANGFGMAVSGVLLTVMFSFIGYQYQKASIHHDVNTLKGSSKWGDVREATSRMAEWADEKKTQLGFYNAIFSQGLRMSLDYKHHTHTMNTLVLGTTGTGKSYTIIKPNLMQMNASFVVTDPKGELLLSCGEALRRFGYNVRVFDLVAMGNCNTYNPMKYCKRESDIKKLVQAFIKNTSPPGGGGSKDPFWDDSMNAFLCACISLLVDYCGDKTEDALGPFDRDELICNVNGKPYNLVPTFADLCELTRMANSPEEGASTKGQNNTANVSKLNTIFNNIRERFADEDEKPYCLREWDNFKIAPEKTSTTILMTTAVRLDPFNIEQVKQLTSTDTINLDTFANAKDALFVITPVNDSTYNFLVSFMYTQLFDILYTHGEKECEGSLDLLLPNGDLVKHFSKEEVAAGVHKTVISAIKKATIKKVEGEVGHAKKKVKTGKFFKRTTKVPITIDDSYYEIFDANGELISRRPTKELAEKYVKDLQHAKERPGKGTRLPCHVRFMLDEFCNICEIPEFKEKLSTMRSYEISCVVICQTITQLKGKYEKDYEVVDANCPEVVFLGGTENTNNEYISKKIGSSTIKGWNNSPKTNKGVKSIDVNSGVEERALIKPEELGRMEPRHNITIIDGEDPIYDKTFDFKGHANYKFTHDYMNDLGLGHLMSFDRAKLAGNINAIPVKRMPVEKPTAIPDCKVFTDQDFMRIFRCPDMDDAYSSFEHFNGGSFEESSVASAF